MIHAQAELVLLMTVFFSTFICKTSMFTPQQIIIICTNYSGTKLFVSGKRNETKIYQILLSTFTCTEQKDELCSILTSTC